MSKRWQEYAGRFDAQTLRERGLIAISLLVAIGFVWWMYYADPTLAQIDTKQTENRRLQMERDILKKAAAFFANELT